MFNSVTFEGFDGRPDLRAIAERITPILADEVSDFHSDVAIVWKPGPNALSPLCLSMTLTLPAATATYSNAILSEDLNDEEELRSRYRKVWRGVLDRYLDQRRRAWDEIIRTPVEV
jgi:hypothetical protein